VTGSTKLDTREADAIQGSDDDARLAGAQDGGKEAEPAFFDRRRIIQTIVIVLLLVAGIYILLPKVVGLEDSLATLDDGDPLWIAVAFVLTVLISASYIALFRGVVGENVLHLEWREAYEISMASLAASRLFSGGGAGGIVLTYWALRKAGMERRESACRMVAFLALLYSVYLVSLVVFGILLRTGILAGSAPPGLTIVPAVIGGSLIALLGLIALIPADIDRRLARWSAGHRFGRLARRLITVPDTLARGIRTAVAFVREPRRGSMALAGSIGFWAANIAALWASFKAFDVHVTLGVIVQGYFVGMVANLIPGAPGGVGTVDAGMIGAYVLFGLPGASVFAAVLIYRLFAFWLPVLPGFIAFLQLRRTVARWDRERAEGGPVAAEAAG
jgi:uncharacterized protein (TIRG00374 family)